MTKEEYSTLVNYLDSLGPSDMRAGTYDVQLTHIELEGIVSALEEIITW